MLSHRSHSAAPMDSPTLCYRGRSQSPAGHHRSLSPPDHRMHASYAPTGYVPARLDYTIFTISFLSFLFFIFNIIIFVSFHYILCKIIKMKKKKKKKKDTRLRFTSHQMLSFTLHLSHFSQLLKNILKMSHLHDRSYAFFFFFYKSILQSAYQIRTLISFMCICKSTRSYVNCKQITLFIWHRFFPFYLLKCIFFFFYCQFK